MVRAEFEKVYGYQAVAAVNMVHDQSTLTPLVTEYEAVGRACSGLLAKAGLQPDPLSLAGMSLITSAHMHACACTSANERVRGASERLCHTVCASQPLPGGIAHACMRSRCPSRSCPPIHPPMHARDASMCI